MNNSHFIKNILPQSSRAISPLDAEVLLAFVLGKPREFVIAHPEYRLSLLERWRFLFLVWRRGRGVPVAYLVGEKYFYGLPFFVNKHTLVPRPDTERMVEEAVAAVRELGADDFVLVDVGTGSGCIPISIAKTLQHDNIATRLALYAGDVSKGALKVAKRNAERHGADITFLYGNLLQPFLALSAEALAKVDSLVVTANLPYLTEEQWQAEASIRREPKLALVADDGGLALYEELFLQITRNTSHVSRTTVFCEIDPGQTEGMLGLVSSYFSEAKVDVVKDLAGHDRVVKIVAT